MLILLLFFVCAWTSPIHGAFVHERDKHLDSLRFTQNFSANDPPKLHHSPLIVEFQVNLRNVLEINELEQTISLETSIRMFWKDHRISLSKKNVPYLTFNPEYLKDAFWIPDVFVDEAKDLRSPQYQLRPSSLRVYNDSTLRFSSRVNFDIKCSMWFHRFPNDVQVCDVKLESFGYTTNEVIFKWKKSGNDVNKNISLPNFDFFIETNESYNTGSIYSLSYPGVAMKVRLSRKLTYHILQTYIPSIMLVVVSWFSLFIPIEEIPGRVGMVTMSLVTLMALYTVVRKEVPQVSYISLLDLWMFSSMSFIVLILLHYVIISYFLSKHRNKLLPERINMIGIWGISFLFLSFCTIYWGFLIY